MTYWRYDPAEYPVGSVIHVVDGQYGYSDVLEYVVERATATQRVGTCTYPNGNVATIRVTESGKIVGESHRSWRRIVGPEEVGEWRAAKAVRLTWVRVRVAAESIDKAARNADPAALAAALEALATAQAELAAQGIEARSDETLKAAQPVGQEPGPSGCAQTPAECFRDCDDPECPYTHTPGPNPITITGEVA